MDHSNVNPQVPVDRSPTPTPPKGSPSLFEQARRVFDGWRDPESGLLVLRALTPERLSRAGIHDGTLHTLYHQSNPFQDGGRRVRLRPRGPQFRGKRHRFSYVMDLATGEITSRTGRGSDAVRAVRARLRSARVERKLAAHGLSDWRGPKVRMLADGRHALLEYTRGTPYDEPCDSRFYMLDAEDDLSLVLAADGFHCNHSMPCPTDPDLFAYDRWPTPKPQPQPDVIIHIASVDGTIHRPLPQIEGTVRPGTIWGGQRDHYLWTPDGRRIASYFATGDLAPSGDHHDFEWWVSVMDWRTGEDLAVPYPAGRWGCNFQVSPDSRFIVSAGAPSWHYLYLIEIEGLRGGWNERILCRYPTSVPRGPSRGPYHMPFVLPDQSGVIFSAGWPGPDEGVYLVEWPADLRG